MKLTSLGTLSLAVLAGLSTVACTAGTSTAAAQVRPDGPPANASGWRAVPVVENLDRPWGMAWLPDGNMLITLKAGQLLQVNPRTGTRQELRGLPPVFSGGQGGLMDVALDPDFAQNQRIFLTFSEGSNRSNRTVLARGILNRDRISNVEVIFGVSQSKDGGGHFGSRIVWMPDKTMLLAIGDGGNPPTSLNGRNIRDQAQNRQSHLGKVLRLTRDGRPAPGNPFLRDTSAAPELFSYGHRNIQGMVRDPQTGRIYATEHGAKGGDELNLVEAGKNYGWPLVTHSTEYWGPKISEQSSRPGMVDPLVVWTPSTGPSGLALVTSDRYPAWKGDLMAGGLASRDLRRVDLDAQGRVVGQQRLMIGQRVRDVRQGPDGFLYVLTDEGNGRLLRIELE